MAVYLTDKIDRSAVSPLVRHEDTVTLADDLSDFEAPASMLCSASSDEARDKLCAAYVCDKLPRKRRVEYKPGDRVLVGSWGLDGKAHWCLRSFA